MKPRFFLSNRKVWASTIVGILLLSCIWSLVAPYWQLRNKTQIARQSWEQKQPRHYKYDATWKGVLFLVEVQDSQVVQVIDLSTNRLPESFFWSHAKKFVLLNELFQTIYQLFITPEPSIDEYISMSYPEIIDLIASYGIPITSWVNPCVYPLPIIHYHSEWGYPEYLKFRGSPCNARVFGTPIPEEELIISNFQPLP